MNVKNVLFYGIIIIIVILLFFNYRLTTLEKDLKLACVSNYTEYLINKTCPCIAPIINNPMSLNSFNLTP